MKNKIKQQLLNMQDLKFKNFHQNLCPGIDNIIGIKTPILRSFAKELIKEYNIQELIIQLDNEYYEEIMLQGMIIGFEKRFDETKSLIKKFVPKINNWAICDTFAASLKITKKHLNEMFSLLNNYLSSDCEFEIRFGIVMLLDYFINEEYIDNVLLIYQTIKSEYYYVKMAIAWGFSICLIKYFDKTLTVFKTNNLDEFTHNKSIQKACESFRLTEEQKQILKKYKRGKNENK